MSERSASLYCCTCGQYDVSGKDAWDGEEALHMLMLCNPPIWLPAFDRTVRCLLPTISEVACFLKEQEGTKHRECEKGRPVGLSLRSPLSPSTSRVYMEGLIVTRSLLDSGVWMSTNS